MRHAGSNRIWKCGPRRFAVLAAVLVGSAWFGAMPASAGRRTGLAGTH